MKSTMRRFHRAGLLGILALQGAALGLVAGEARAAWHCTVVDGPDSTNPGSSGVSMMGANSAILWNGLAVPIYTRHPDNTSLYYPRDGSDFNFGTQTCSGNSDPFSVGDITGGNGAGIGAVDDAFSFHAIQDGGTTWFTYAQGGSIYVAQSGSGPVPGAAIYTNPGASGAAAYFPRLVMYGGQPWVFYETGTNQIYYQSYNGSSWSVPTYLDGSFTHPVSYASAAAFDGALWVLYNDTQFGGVQGKYWDGSAWHTSDVNATNYIDGAGGPNGQDNDYTGRYTTAMVDTHASPNRLYVFYYDWSGIHHGLRASYKDAGGGSWIAQSVETGFDMDGWPAPVLHAGIQVYYVDYTHYRIRGVGRSGNVWGTPSTIDGDTSNQCGLSGGGSTDKMFGSIAVVERAGCQGGETGPHVFYGAYNQATNHHNLREAFWY